MKPEQEALAQQNGVAVPGTWYGQAGKTVIQEVALPEPIPHGKMVQLHSLSSAELNGRVGECGAFNEAKGRYAVLLAGDDRARGVKPVNLRAVAAPSADDGKASAELSAKAIKIFTAIRASGTAEPTAFIALTKTLGAALEKDPCNHRAHQCLGDVCVFRDESGQNKALQAAAIKHFRRAAENGGGLMVRYLLSGCLGRSGDMGGELGELKKILMVDPENLLCACSLGRLHQNQERHEEALGELLRLLASPDVNKGDRLALVSVMMAFNCLPLLEPANVFGRR